MKPLLTVLFILYLFLNVNAQKYEINFNAVAGITAVDVAEAIGYPMEDWNTFYYGGYVQGFLLLKENFSVGADIGYQHLYYYEYYYSYGGYYLWGDINTFHIGPTFQFINKNFYG